MRKNLRGGGEIFDFTHVLVFLESPRLFWPGVPPWSTMALVSKVSGGD